MEWVVFLGWELWRLGMPGTSKLAADAAEQAALRDLSKSEQRGEADRARAILLTLEGRRAGGIAAVALAPIAPKGLCGRPPRVKSAFESELPCRLRVCVRPVRAATWPLAQMGVRLPKLPFRLRAERASLWHGLSPGVVRPTVHALLRLGLSEAALCR